MKSILTKATTIKTAVSHINRSVILGFMFIGTACAGETPTTCEEDCPAPYVENQFWTSEYGTAAADVLTEPTNFLACTSNDYALCYFSGPNEASKGKKGTTLPALPCTVSKDNPDYADCRCYAETGESYVSINSIANTEAYIETVRTCGLAGEKCVNMVSQAVDELATKMGMSLKTLATAPVCSYLQSGSDGMITMAPNAELASTFSFAETKNYHAKQTTCSTALPYAGCMTASCTFEKDANGNKTGFANCRCPIFTGPFQVGQANVQCNLGGDNVWSAAYAPPSGS